MKKLSIFALTVILSCIFSVSTFAVTEYPVFSVSSTWTSETYPSVNVTLNCDSNVFVFRGAGNDGFRAFSSVSGGTVSWDSWTAWNGAVHDGGSAVCNIEAGSGIWVSPVFLNGIGADTLLSGSSLGSLSDIGWNGTSTITQWLPSQSSVYDALLAFAADHGGPDVPAYSYVDIPAGYVAVLKGRNPSDYSAATFRTSFTWSSSPNQPYWGNTGHSYKFFDSRPVFTGSTLFPLSGSTSFNWLKMGSFGPNGATKGAYYDISFGNTYHWIVIYNPFYTFDSSTSNPKYNSTVRCYAQLAEVYLYPVAQLLDSDGWTGRSLQDWENPYVGVAPEGTSGDGLFSGSEPWTFVQDSSDDPGTTVPAVPQPGGDNEVPVQVTLPEIILKFGDLLTGFFDNLLSLFGKGEEAIIALIGIAAPFFSLIGMIFTWLPTDIVAFITAAISATVFLGLLKHFL